MYDLGEGVSKDKQKAVAWYRLAAEQGYALSQYTLGVIYEKGDEVAQEPKEAFEWYREAAQQGFAQAQNNLGSMYEHGLGVRNDNVLAHMWYNLSAANGNDLGGKNRDAIAQKLTLEEIANAKSMARKCINSDYQTCGHSEG